MAVATGKSARSRSRAAPEPLTLAQVMDELERAGSAQTRKTYARHGAQEPMFGVSFATLKALVKRIRVDHALGLALWDTGNFDARNLAVKVVDPARFSPRELDSWAAAETARMCGNYVAWIAAEGAHGPSCATRWLAATNPSQRCTGWKLVGALAMLDEGLPDDRFTAWLAAIERDIHAAPDAEREAMNGALISIGCRNAVLRKSATAAARTIGKVEVDHGDTACKTPDAVTSIDKAWDHSTTKGHDSPAAHERSRESLRTRC